MSSAFLGRAAALGAASGLRTTAGLGALTFRGDSDLPGVLRHRGARPAAAVAVGTELVLDKLPITGSRLDPPGLVGRVLFAGLAAAALAASERRSALLPVALAGAASLAAAKVGHDVRAALARRFPDLALAVVEDALTAGLAVAASS